VPQGQGRDGLRHGAAPVHPDLRAPHQAIRLDGRDTPAHGGALTEPATGAADFVRAFLDAIERNEVVGREADWYTEDAIQVEFPNRLAPNGATRDLAGLREAGERGQAIVERQSYEIVSLVEQGDRVGVEAIFRATFRIDVLGLPKGATMEARFAMFFELRDGRITRHHSYDCFLPW
jgi:ketosteroid isomerase-like protein